MPGPVAVTGAMAVCTFGGPGSLVALPVRRVMVEGRPVLANVDISPVNAPTFGMCRSLANPVVAAATSLASGVLTPQPCLPAIVTPWSPGGPRTIVGGVPVLTAGSSCTCAYGGVIAVVQPGATRTTAS